MFMFGKTKFQITKNKFQTESDCCSGNVYLNLFILKYSKETILNIQFYNY